MIVADNIASGRVGLRDTGERVVPEFVHPQDELASNLYAQHLARYRAVAAKVAGCSVLDVACGAGYGSKILADAGAREIVGIDRDPAVIDYAVRHYSDDAIVFRTGTLDMLSRAGFDVIACLETLEHVEEPTEFLHGLAARLTPGGALFVSATTVPTRLLYQYHLHDFSEDEFLRLIETSGFRIDDVLRQEFRATPKMVRRSMVLHPQATIPRYLSKTPIKFLAKLVSACLIDGFAYRNIMARCSIRTAPKATVF